MDLDDDIFDLIRHRAWEIEVEMHIEHGVDPYDAWMATVLRWMQAGDLRPLAAAWKEGHEPDGNILDLLSDMIEDGRLKVHNTGGRPTEPALTIRDMCIASYYDGAIAYGKSFEAALEGLAKAFGTSPETIRKVVERLRK
jgi:hypothetical protein